MKQVHHITYQLPQTESAQPDDLVQNMYFCARAFYIAANRCSANIPLRPNLRQSLGGPSATCYALAVELYLKTLSKIRGIEYKRVHHFQKLYANLPDDERKELSAGFGRFTKLEPAKLDSLLSDIGDSFVKWRYSFEEETLCSSSFDFEMLCTLLHNRIRVLKPGFPDT